MEISERDWKLFRSKVPQWQDTYMEQLCKEYIALLSSDGAASEKFWALEKRIHDDKKSPGVCVDMRRSQMINNIQGLLNDRVITQSDLSEFSQDLRDTIAYLNR